MEILEDIELFAADEYTFDKIRVGTGLIRPLMEDIEKDRVKWFVEIITTDGDIDPFIHYSGMTLDELDAMFKKHEERIELRKDDIKLEKQTVKEKKVRST